MGVRLNCDYLKFSNHVQAGACINTKKLKYLHAMKLHVYSKQNSLISETKKLEVTLPQTALSISPSSLNPPGTSDDGKLWLAVEFDLGHHPAGVWLAHWTHLCPVLLYAESLCRLLPRL